VPALVRAMRPKQWLKNVLVFAAPGAAGVLTHGRPFVRATEALVVFCAAASGTYLINNAVDAEADRLHVKKRTRPVAAGHVPAGVAAAVGAFLLASSTAVSLAVGDGRLAIVVACYAGISVAYSLWLKREPVIELAAIASGFVLRAIAGGVAAGVPISQWFLIVASFGSLFIAAGKRSAEQAELGDNRAHHRVTLSDYTPDFLRHIRTVCSAVAISAYCLWAFEKAHAATHGIWFELSIVPFVLALFRYGLLLDTGHGSAPEDVVTDDVVLVVLGVVWLAIFAAGIYVT
jgi:decaprenyl-phosphate phosphoribosyltransferase